MKCLGLWMLGLVFLVVPAAFGAVLTHVAVNSQAGVTSVYLSLSGPFTHQLFSLKQPHRLVLDLGHTQLKTSLNQSSMVNSLIRGVRSGLPKPNILRLVFELSRSVSVRSSFWPPHGLRIDLLAASKPLPPDKQPTHLPKSVQSVVANPPRRPIAVTHKPSPGLRDVIVILDAGHGGKDPGAHGPAYSREKGVVLSITLKLKQLINRQPGMRAILTRSGDYYVGLRQRLNIARKYGGDIFVSIHADAFDNPHSSGAAVYALSQRGATSEAARWIAEKENYSELGGVNLGDLDDRNGVVRSVLIDLSQTATIHSSLQMGARVLGQLNRLTNLHHNKVEQAGFMVLKSTDIPSILVETGFISNPREERNLNNAGYQTRLSQAIFQGIKSYFWDNPPHGSRIERMTLNRFHIVQAGDTWPLLSQRYHLSVVAIQKSNHLSNTASLKFGQRLVIPPAWS